MLILFDIDGTMLHTQRAGVSAMTSAFEELSGKTISFEGIEIAGRLDVLIWRDLVRKHGLEETDAEHDRFRGVYGRHLDRRLKDNPTALAMPGVAALVEALAEMHGVTLGLLTGNYPETAKMKISAAGFDPDLFVVGAWGCDGKHRRDLPPVAIKRFAELGRGAVLPENVVILGDTPHDVDCARHNGCRSIGVATGVFSVEDLEASGADLAVPTLEDTATLIDWMVGSQQGAVRLNHGRR